VRSWRRAAAVMCVLRRLFPPRSFAIRQHAASRVLDGAHLLTLLQQASGASNFGKAVAESNVKLEKERESLRSVRTDVAQRGQSRHPALRQGSPPPCLRLPASLPPPPRLPASASLPPCLRLPKSAVSSARVAIQVAALEEMLTTEHEEAAALRQLLKLRSQLKGARESRREAGGQLLAVSTAKDLAVGAACCMRAPSWWRRPSARLLGQLSQMLDYLERRALTAQVFARIRGGGATVTAWQRTMQLSARCTQAERAVGLRLDSALEQAATLQEVLRAQRDELGE
jgi:hypothetical protein